ncbi:MAG TPA: NAD(+) synthase, partial [Steroidobacteraceae bacterium]|nr:NAD(+) synthase [Steroidobacteraceae bacterium]
TAASMKILNDLRSVRGFDAGEVAITKIALMSRWFREQNLDAAVVGVSGGVDSALVLALLVAVMKQPGSQLRRVVALLMPIESVGATNQTTATARGREVAIALGAEVWEAPLTDALASTIAALTQGSKLPFDAWAEGQCLSVMRTPALYGAASLLQTHGFRSIVCGTTNRDEGAFLGFFGKASDGMVDLQPIADLHKSEVRALARYLNVPDHIIDATPRGDVHDGRTDEEMIGASYDEIETYLRLREFGRSPYLGLAENVVRAIEAQHAKNAHKYRVGSPAVMLDVLPRAIPGGAKEYRPAREEKRPTHVPGSWEPASEIAQALGPVQALPGRESVDVGGGFAILAKDVLTTADAALLCESMKAAAMEAPVGISGYSSTENGETGSWRATGWSVDLAAALYERLRPALPCVRFLDDHSFTDAHGQRAWRIVGLSPLLRFMRYPPGGRHLCHYDAAYDYGDGRRTLLSVVFYLTDAEMSGATRFVRDGQEALPTAKRCFDDWTRDTRPDEVTARVVPRVGSVLVFDHRLCHDVERWDGPGDRIIIRADVVYEAIG